jgi:hypothetical protein
MLRNYFLLNILLIISAGVLGFKLYKSIPQPLDILSRSVPKEAISEESDKKKTKDIIVKRGGSDFQIIVKKDLFRPGRKESEVKVEEVPTPDFYPRLIGTLITEKGAVAYLEDPKTNATKGFRINDSIEGFTVHEILRDRVILLKGDEKVWVKLGAFKTEEPKNRSPSGPGVSNVDPSQQIVQEPTRPVYIPPRE